MNGRAQADLAQRAMAVAESKTARFLALVNRLRSRGRPVINLSVGEPEYPPDEAVIQATCKALENHQTRYGPVGGLPALRQRLAEDFTDCDSGQVVVTNGAKQALYSLFQVLCNPGDEVIVPRPCWVSFPEQIRLAGGTPVLVDTVDHQIEPDLIRRAVTDRTRAILINTPNNPTGAVYAPERVEAVARIADACGAWLIADEAYHAFVYDDWRYVRTVDLAPDPSRVITVRSFSKQYSLTGFRVGYAVGPTSVIDAMVRIQSHLCGNVCTFAQHGALAALDLDEHLAAERLADLQRKRDLAVDIAAEWSDCVRPQGAFYLLADVSRHLDRNRQAQDLAMDWLEQAGVAVVPGEAFGVPQCVRISFAAPAADIQNGLERIGKRL